MGKFSNRYRLAELGKKTVCMPAHLPEDIAEHVASKAYERDWSNSQYLRWLAIQDKKRCEDDNNLMAKVSGVAREQLDPFRQIDRCEHCERKMVK
ncbi:hypothetical protein RFH42_16340 [Acinetobacter rudis]|uniref:hypothetical protein n=1 Tax=Acinetobacter rudis TaxID=632955 RepID=UPI00280F8E2A|nr:hypothetical protein [Acinetobacter rudis]MDQ8954520.1 hypothetical protein [Acinetobacter rudis]